MSLAASAFVSASSSSASAIIPIRILDASQTDFDQILSLGQKRDVNKRRFRLEDGAAPFDADVEKDVTRACDHEIRRETERPTCPTLEEATAAGVGSEGFH